MKLEGSCHCKRVRFSLESHEPVPFMRCYCSICRKTAGAGGYAINIGGDFDSMQVEGKKYVSVYQAVVTDKETGESKQSPGQRSFCSQCGSALWMWDPRWPQLVHPHASTIDTPLPTPPQHIHIMLGSKAEWVAPQIDANDKQFKEYPDESLAAWHMRMRKAGRVGKY